MPNPIMCGKHAKIYKSGPYYRVISNYSGLSICTTRSSFYALSIAVDQSLILKIDEQLSRVPPRPPFDMRVS